MSFINSLYQKSVADNERNLRFWEDYLNNLKRLDFNVYADKLKIPTLVPIGSRVFFRGELKHTSEVTVALGADYFVKCSIAQAEVLRRHRIKDAESKLALFQKEKQYLENQLSFTQKSIFEKEGQEILEVFTEEEDQAWRQKHRENVRKYKQGQAKEEKPTEEITDEELWSRLEELELEEELESELLENYNEIVDKRKENNFLIEEEQKLLNSSKGQADKDDTIKEHTSDKQNMIDEKTRILKDKMKKEEENESMSKHQLLQQVFDKQNELEEKLLQIKNRDKKPSKSEQDLISHLDEMEQLEELEDDMERLEDILETEDIDSDDNDDKVNFDNTIPVNLKKSISFADHIEDTGKTIEITFTHSEVEPCKDPYDPGKGILKPSDIYEAHASLFKCKPSSILKKSKYDNANDYPIKDTTRQAKINLTSTEDEPVSCREQGEKEIIVVKDVVETSGGYRSKINTDARPKSLFKQRRMQSKH